MWKLLLPSPANLLFYLTFTVFWTVVLLMVVVWATWAVPDHARVYFYNCGTDS
jgi:hypothetical protein